MIPYHPPYGKDANFRIYSDIYTAPPGGFANFFINGGTRFEGSGVLSGVVRVNDELQTDCIVSLYSEDTQELLQSTTTNASGEFIFEGLNTEELFYIVAKEPSNAWEYRISSRRKPITIIYPPLQTVGELYTNDLENGLDGTISILGGQLPLSVEIIDPLPFGLTPVIQNRTLTVIGTSQEWGRKFATIRVRSRNNDFVDIPVTVDINAEWTPENLGTLPKIWLDWDSSVTDASGFASAWSNKGSLGGAFTQPTAGYRPEILTSALNGNRVLRFDGEDDWLGDDSLVARNIFRNVRHGWALVVYKKRFEDSIAVNRHILSSLTGSSTARFYIRAGSTSAGKNKLQLVVRRLDADPAPNLAAADENLNWQISVAVMRWDTGSGYLYSNGRLVAQDDALTSAGATSDTTPSQHIRLATSGSGSECGDIDMGAAIIHGGDDLIDEDRQRLEGWFAHALGMQVSLDESHPFRAVAPYAATPALQQSIGSGPVVLGFVSATSGGNAGAAIGPAVTPLGTWFNGGPSLGAGQGVSVMSDGDDITVTLTSIAPPTTPAQAVLLDHRGMPIVTIPLTASGSDYSGIVPGTLEDDEVYYIKIEAQ